MRIKNSKGDVYYGMHFYPGVAEYRGDDGDSFRVFLNEDTIRRMDPSFAGRPVFVRHVTPEMVDKSVDDLRGEADGWVVESFFNSADGKHWVKFLVCSEKGRDAIRQGFRLSNCYRAKQLGPGGEWSGVSFQKEVKDGEYEHLALVADPRYDESIVLTPEQFKAYNAKKEQELKRLANNKDREETSSVKFPKLFQRAVVQNAADLKLDELIVQLPKSNREVPFMVLVNEADEAEEKKKGPMYANADHLVDMGNSTSMTVGDLVSKHQAVCNELEELKAKNASSEETDDDDDAPPPSDDDAPTENEEDDEPVENEEDPADKELDDAKSRHQNAKAGATKKPDVAAKAKAAALRAANARSNMPEAAPIVDLAMDQMARGRTRYGTN